MIHLSELKIGHICTVKKSFVISHNIHEDFTKNGSRPFVIAEIKDYGIIWIVPCYSHCKEYNEGTSRFYFTLNTPSGIIKYLNYRNMIPVDCNAISSIYTPSQNTIPVLEGQTLKTFLIKYKSNKTYLKKNIEKSNLIFKHPFLIEKELIIHDYLDKPYYWLERYYNIVDLERQFHRQLEYQKAPFADGLYYNYQNNLKYFLRARNKYIPNRYAYLISQFSKTKLEQRYICFTDKGFVKQIGPLEFSENILNSKLLTKEELVHIDIPYDIEIRNVEVPMLSDIQKQHVIKELIYLENLTVSEKTYYGVFGKTPDKKQILAYEKEHKL